MNATFITSSEMARLTGIAQSTVTWYANTGVISPIRDSSGRRLYTHADAETLIQLRAAKASSKARAAAA
jgi:DNA-binding transcriptional MerR regulator